jgi:hypothetical protein
MQILLKRLKRWLGWDSDSGLLDFADLETRSRGSQAPKPTAPTSAPRPAEKTGTPPAPRRAKNARTPAEVLDNPRLTLDKPPDNGFDPYNTGAFNRSQSWEKIGRQRKR